MILKSNGKCDSFGIVSCCWGAMGGGSTSAHCHIGGEKWALEWSQCRTKAYYNTTWKEWNHGTPPVDCYTVEEQPSLHYHTKGY